MEGEKKKGLKVTTIWLMIATALFFDVLQTLLEALVIGYFVPVIAYPTFWLWFRFHGINFFSSKNATVLGIGTLIELIPGIDVLPAFTGIVARVALTNKLQEIVPGSEIVKLDIMKRK